MPSFSGVIWCFLINLDVCVCGGYMFASRPDVTLPFHMALGHHRGVGSSGRRMVAVGTQALVSLPSGQWCRSSSFSMLSLLQGPLGMGPQLSFLLVHCSHIISCKTFTWRRQLILATINSHCNLFRIGTVSINGKGTVSIQQPGSY